MVTSTTSTLTLARSVVTLMAATFIFLSPTFSQEEDNGIKRIPLILNKVRESEEPTALVAAHRGGYENDRADEAPENSVANIRVSAAKGFDLFETDIQRTRDGHFVIMHDPTIDRETTGSGKVSEMDLAELKTLKKRYRDGSISEEPVATLEEFLEAGKESPLFQVDIKPGVDQYFGELIEVVKKHGATDKMIFRVPYEEADFYHQFYQESGPLPKHLLMFKVQSNKQIDDIRDRFDTETVSIGSGRLDPTDTKMLALFKYAREQGFLVASHSAGDEEDWLNLINAGVGIFYAKKPSRLKALIDSLKETDGSQ